MREPAPAQATEREVVVVAAVFAAGSEKAAVHRLGLSHSTVNDHLANARSKVEVATTAQLVWILAPRWRDAEGDTQRGGIPGASQSARSRRARLSRSELTVRMRCFTRRGRVRDREVR